MAKPPFILLLEQGLSAHQRGDLATAEKNYRAVMTMEPDQCDALHLLGVILHQKGNHQESAAWIRKALAINPNIPGAWTNLGLALERLGDLDGAISCHKESLRRNPNHADTLNNLGLTFKKVGNAGEAKACFRKAISLVPGHAGAHNNLAGLLLDAGAADEACVHARHAAELAPHNPEFQFSLAKALKQGNKPDEARRVLEQCLRMKPNHVAALNSLGNLLSEQGLPVEAESQFRQAIQVDDRHALSHFNLSVLLEKRMAFDEAMQEARLAVACDAQFAEAHNQLGHLELARGMPSAAAEELTRAIEINPAYAEAHCNMGNALVDHGLAGRAQKHYMEAIRINPNFDEAHHNLLLSLNYQDQIGNESIFEEHRHWGSKHATALLNGGATCLDWDGQRPLRVAYLSPDFRQHSVSYFIEPLLEKHQASRFDIYCYSDVATPDDRTKRLKALAHHWRDTSSLTDEALAKLINNDRIDLLVDLAGHTAGNRLLVMARKPAPLQATFLGYPNTTGLETIDYRITDSTADPQGETDRYYSEALYRLDRCFLCYKPDPHAPEVNMLPSLSAEKFVFGSFNNMAKLSHSTLSLWGRILAHCPDAKLLIKARPLCDPQMRDHIITALTDSGANPDQILLSGWEEHAVNHLSKYHQVDLCLDSFPYNGTTTTCEAMWMGIPVITLSGDRHASRVGSSLNKAVGLESFTALTPESYVALATQWTQRLEELASIRQTLRQRMLASQLCDADNYARQVENAFTDMAEAALRRK